MLGRSALSGEVSFPAVPGLSDSYVSAIFAALRALGHHPSQPEHEHLRNLLDDALARINGASARIITRYHSEGARVIFDVELAASTLAEEFTRWSAHREGSLFGDLPDARLLALTTELALQPGARCLDVGAGVGRNALALAERDLHVDCIEMTPHFANELSLAGAERGVEVRINCSNVFDVPLEADAYSLVVVSEMTSHFSGAGELEAFLLHLAPALRHDGRALINLFLVQDDWRPDSVARDAARAAWSTFFTLDELERALARAGLALESQVDVLSYERAHQPEDTWPPTPWFESWASGRDVFGGELIPSPIALAWLVLRRL